MYVPNLLYLLIDFLLYFNTKNTKINLPFYSNLYVLVFHSKLWTLEMLLDETH